MNEKNYNWNVSYSTKLPISSSELWSIISSPKNLENFHPFCNKNKIFKWPGLGSLDEIHYYEVSFLDPFVQFQISLLDFLGIFLFLRMFE